MLSLRDIAHEFERGLNAQLRAENIENVEFRIWVNAGQHTKPVRSGNSVVYYIDCILRPTASTNLGTLIDMGSWTLTLEGAIPIPPPRTSAYPSDGELSRIYGQNYDYALNIFTAVDNYFSIAEELSISAGGGKSFSVGIRAGAAISGLAGLLHGIGESVGLTVYIDLGYTEGGINSRSASIAIDDPDNVIPAMSTDINRANVLQSDLYQGHTNRQSVASASAITIAVMLPLTDSTGQAYDFLVDGDLNVAHFVFYRLGEKTTAYWMTVDDPTQSSKEVSNIGISYHLIETVNDIDIVNVPTAYQVGKLFLSDPNIEEFEISPHAAFYAMIGSQILLIEERTTVNINKADMSYDDEERKYFIPIVINKDANFNFGSSSGVYFVPEKRAGRD